MDLSEGNHYISKISLLEFQPLLAETLYEIISIYQEICRLEKCLIGNKLHYNNVWFKQKMASYARYKTGISETIKIGKSIGDTFAWIFYCDNNAELQKQCSHEQTGLFTANIGGKGEIEFIKNNLMLYGCFLIYHGITNILRIGDFSLYAQDHGIIATGELKSEISENGLIVNAFITSKFYLQDDENLQSIKTIDGINVQNPQKFKRQLKAIEDVLSTRKSDLKKDFQTNNLHHLLDEIKQKSQPIVIDAQNKIILSRYSCRCRKLSSLLLEKTSPNNSVSDDDLIKATTNILVPKQKHNKLYFGEISSKVNYSDKPIMLWDINREMIHDIVFRKCAVVTIYNPVDFIEYFLNRGYKINMTDKTIEFQLHRENKVITLSNINFFLSLIVNSLMSPMDVISLIENSLKDCVDNVTSNTFTELRIIQK